MELVEGGDLLSLLKNVAVVLEWPLRARMAREIAGAIAFLHGRNVVHRDLKSENILVEAAGSRAKLCDFGFARAVERRQRASTLLGTPYYSAPEILLGKHYDAAKTDVFAFGVLVLVRTNKRTNNLLNSLFLRS
jgi:serine/threonine protein kinase